MLGVREVVMLTDVCHVLNTMFAACWNFNLPFLHGVCNSVDFGLPTEGQL